MLAQGLVKGLAWELAAMVLALDRCLDTNADHSCSHNGPGFGRNMRQRGNQHLHHIRKHRNNTCLHQGSAEMGSGLELDLE